MNNTSVSHPSFIHFLRFPIVLITLLALLGFTPSTALAMDPDLSVDSVTLTEVDGSAVASDAPLVPGQTATFDIVVSNNNSPNARIPVVTVSMPNVNATVVSSSSTGSNWNNSSSGFTFARRSRFPGNTTETLTLTVLIPANAHYVATAPISVAAGVVTQNNESDSTNNEASTDSLSLQAKSALTVDKISLNPVVAQGGTAFYDIVVCNDGPSDIDGLALNDNPGANLLVSTLAGNDDAISFYVHANNCRNLEASVQVDPAADVGDNFVNTVDIITSNAIAGSDALTGFLEDPEFESITPATNSEGEVGEVLADADVEITSVTLTQVNGSDVDPDDPIVPGQTATFEVEVTNNGDADAIGVSVINRLRSVMPMVVSASSPGAPWSNGGSGLSFDRQEPMPADTTETLVFTVRIPSDAHYFAANEIRLNSFVAASNPDPDIDNNKANSGSLDVQAQAELALGKTLLTPIVPPGGTALYELVLCNNGPSDIDGVEITDTPGDNLDASTLITSWDIESIYVAASRCIDILVSVQVNDDAVVDDSFTNTAELDLTGVVDGAAALGGTALDAEVNEDDDTNDSGTVGQFLPDADIEITSVEVTEVNGVPVPAGENPILVPGQSAEFEIEITNNGDAPAEGATVLNFLQNLQYTLLGSGGSSSWTRSSGITFKRLDPMPADTSETISLTVLIPADAHYQAQGGLRLRTAVIADNPDPTPENNSDNTGRLRIRANADLTITKTLFTPVVAPGGTALYEIEICNDGPSDIDGIELIDVPGEDLIGASLVLGAGAESLYIAAGGCVDVLASVRVADADTGGNDTFSNFAEINADDVINGAAVLGNRARPAEVNEPEVTNSLGEFGDFLPEADVRILSVDLTAVGIFPVGPGAAIVPGLPATFRIRVRNSGDAAAEGVTVINLLRSVSGAAVLSFSPGAPWSTVGSGLTFTRGEPMEPGDTDTLFVTVQIPTDAHYDAVSPISFRSTVTADNPDPNFFNNSDGTGVIDIRAIAGLQTVKTLFTTQVPPGGTALYEVLVCNLGPSDIRGVGLVDIPGFNLVPGSAEISADADFDFLNIDAGNCTDAQVSAVVSPAAEVGAPFFNTAFVNTFFVQDGSFLLFGSARPAIVNAPGDTNFAGIVGDFLPTNDVSVDSVELIEVNGSTAFLPNIVPGLTATFEITVSNNGPAPAEGASVVNTFFNVPPQVVSSSSPGAPWRRAGSGLTFNRLQPMPAGSTETLRVTVLVPSDAHYTAQGGIRFRSTISSDNPDSATGNNSFNTGRLDVEARLSLSLAKTLLTPNVAPGGTALYEIALCNVGPSDIDGLEIIDTPGANLDPGSLVLSDDATSVYVPAHQCVDFAASAQVSDDAVVGESFENAVEVSTTFAIPGSIGLGDDALPPSIDPPAVTNDDGVVSDYLPDADVEVTSAILKEIDGEDVDPDAPLVPGLTATFHIEVTNNGDAPAEGVTFLTRLRRGVDPTFVKVMTGDAPWSNSSNGLAFARQLPMPAGTTELIKLTVLIPADAHYQARKQIQLRSFVSSSNPDSDLDNNRLISDTFDFEANAELSISKTLFTPVVSPGGTALYEIVLCNDGPSDIDGINVEDTPGANLFGASLVLSEDAEDVYVGAGRCLDFLASVQVEDGAAVGESFANTVDALVDEVVNGSDALGDTALPAVVAAVSSTNDEGIVGEFLPDADVSVDSVTLTEIDGDPVAPDAPLVPGLTARFAIEVTNNGAAPAEGVTVLNRLREVGAIFVAASSPGAPWSNGSSGFAFARQLPMPAGTTETLNLEILIPSDAHYLAQKTINFRSFVSASNPDSDLDNNRGTTDALDVEAQADLTIEKTLFTAEVSPGGTALYEIVVCNNGPSDIRDLAVIDTVGTNLVDGSAVLSSDAEELHVAAGQCADVTATAVVEDSAAVGESFSNTAAVDADNVNPGAEALGGTALDPVVNEPEDTNDEGVVGEFLPAANVRISDVDLIAVGVFPADNDDALVPGVPATFRIEVRNEGDAPAEGVTVVNTLRSIAGAAVLSFSPGAPWSQAGSGLTFTRGQPMPAGEEDVLIVTVQIPSDAHYRASLPVSFRSTVTASNPDPFFFNNSRGTGILDVQAISLLETEKTLLTTQVPPGGTALYEVLVCNFGPSDIRGVGVDDIPGTNLVPGSVVVSADADLDFLSLAVGGCVDAQVSAVVSDAAAVGEIFENTAVVDTDDVRDGSFFLFGSARPALVTAPDDTNSNGIVGEFLPAADVEVTEVELRRVNGVVVDPDDPIVPGQTATFRITVRNNGPAPAEGATLINTFFNVNPAVVGTGNGGSPWSRSGSGLTFTRSQPMPAGTLETVTVEVFVPADTHYTAQSNIRFRSIATADNPDLIPGNNPGNTGALDVEANADLSLSKTLFTPNVAPGGTAQYELLVCNAGPSDINGVALVDTPGANLVASTLVLSDDADSLYIAAGQCADVGASVEVSDAGAVGESFENAANVDAMFVLNGAPGLGDTALDAVVNEPDASNTVGLVSEFLPDADVEVLSVTLTQIDGEAADPDDPLVPGLTAMFEMEVTNNGPAPAEAVTVIGRFRNIDATMVSAGSPGSPWANFGSGLVTTRRLPMPAGTTDTLRVRVLIPADAHYQAVNTAKFRAVVTASNPDPATGNNGFDNGPLDIQAQAELSISKTLLTPDVAPGGIAFYELLVCNDGPSDIDGVGVTDTPGTNLVDTSLVLSDDADSFYVPAARCVDLSATVQVSDAAAVGEIFENTADIDISSVIAGSEGLGDTALDPDVNTDTDTNSEGLVDNFLPPADVEVVSVTLTQVNGEAADPDDALVPGQTAKFQIVVTNNGPSPAEGVIVLNRLRRGFDPTFVSASSPGAPWGNSSDGFTFVRQQPMPAGVTETLNLRILVPSNAHYRALRKIDFRSFIAASNPDPDRSNNRFRTARYDFQAQADLSLTKTLFTQEVAPGGTAVYELLVCNAGPSDVDGIAVEDFPGENLVDGSQVLSDGWESLYIAAGYCEDILTTVRISNAAAVGESFANTASVDAEGVINGADALMGTALDAIVNEPEDTNDEGTIGEFLPPADVEIVSIELARVDDEPADDDTPIVPGLTARFDISVRNNGPSPAEAVTVINRLRSVAPIFVSASSPSAPWGNAGNGLTFTRLLPMASGEEDTLRLTVLIPPDAHYLAQNAILFRSFVSASNPDPSLPNNRGTLNSIDVQAIAELTIAKTLFTPEVAPGGTALYEIVICNQGPSTLDGVAANDLPGTNLVASDLVLSSDIHDLYLDPATCADAGVSVSIEPGAVPGDDFTNSAEVDISKLITGPGSTLEPIVNAPSTDEIFGTIADFLPAADLEIVEKRLTSGTMVPGTQATFEIDVRNNGPAVAEAVVVTDQFVNGDVVVASTIVPAGWNTAGNGATFTRSSTMPVGTIETLTITFDVPADAHLAAAGPMSNTALVSASNPDPDLDNNSNSTGTIPTQAESTLTLEKLLFNNFALPGSRAEFQIVVCNEGPSDVAGLDIVDTPGANLDADTLVLSPISTDLHVTAGHCKTIEVSIEVLFGAERAATFVNNASVDISGVEQGAGGTLPAIVNEPTAEASGLVGPPEFDISGNVQLPSGEGLPDVGVECDNGEEAFNGVTDEDGDFTVPGAPSATYTCTATAANGTVLGSVEVVVANGDVDGVIIVANPRLDGLAYFVWNGFLEQINVIVLSNKGDNIIDATVKMFDLNGNLTSETGISLNPRSERDLIINSLEGFSPSSYGYLSVEFNNPDDFDGHVALYRPKANGQDIEFSIVKPFENVQQGSTFGGFNTMQPSKNPDQAKNLVLQWLQLVNLNETEEVTFKITFLEQGGGVLRENFVVVPAGARRDVEAGHENPGPGFVGTVMIEPSIPDSPYLSQLFRYGVNADASGPFDSFSFAQGLTTTSGSKATQFVPISRGAGGTNFIIVTNVSSTQATSLGTSAFSSFGGETSPGALSLEPMQQVHIDVSGILQDGDSGILELKPSNGATLVIESSVFFHDPVTGDVTASYGTGARPIFAGDQVGLYNTFFDQRNWVKISNVLDVPVTATIEVFDLEGNSLQTGVIGLSPNGSTEFEIALGFRIPKDTYGIFVVRSSVPGALFSELLRTKPETTNASIIDLSISLPVR